MFTISSYTSPQLKKFNLLPFLGDSRSNLIKSRISGLGLRSLRRQPKGKAKEHTKKNNMSSVHLSWCQSAEAETCNLPHTLLVKIPMFLHQQKSKVFFLGWWPYVEVWCKSGNYMDDRQLFFKLGCISPRIIYRCWYTTLNTALVATQGILPGRFLIVLHSILPATPLSLRMLL